MAGAEVTSLATLSIRDAALRLRRRDISCVDLVRACLERIDMMQPRLNAFITLLPEKALAHAKALDTELAAGRDRGLLHGIPIAHKDLFDTAGVRTTAGSRLFASRIPTRDATVVARLSQAGAVTLGKTNMNELAAGTSGKNVHYGDVRNPLDETRSPGGSSSGTAAAVAGGLCLAGTGSDTGGSLRIPAAANRLVALRPGFGRLPLDGVILRSRTLDTVGPIVRTADDCALLYDAMLGVPPRPQPLRPAELSKLKMAALKDAPVEGFEGRVGEVSLPELLAPQTLQAVMDIMLYEFHDLLRTEFQEAKNPESLFGPVVLANLQRGAQITPARYAACRDIAQALGVAVRKVLSELDFIALPVLRNPVPRLDAPAERFDAQRELTLPLSATGLPVIAVRGVQLVAGDGGEEGLLAAGAAIETRG